MLLFMIGPSGNDGIGLPGKQGDRGEPGRPGKKIISKRQDFSKIIYRNLCDFDIIITLYTQDIAPNV